MNEIELTRMRAQRLVTDLITEIAKMETHYSDAGELITLEKTQKARDAAEECKEILTTQKW